MTQGNTNDPQNPKKKLAGWYTDPNDNAQLRYWDGEQWLKDEVMPNPSPSDNSAVWYPDPRDETILRHWDGSQWITKKKDTIDDSSSEQPDVSDDDSQRPTDSKGQEQDSKSSSETSAPSDKQAKADAEKSKGAVNLDSMPVIKNWKTSIGFSALGFFAGCLMFAVINNLIISFKGYSPQCELIPFIVYIIFLLIYVLPFYDSYFGPKPKIKSNKAISFLNCMFCVFPIGFILNGNLTKTRKDEKRTSVVGPVGVWLVLIFLFYLSQAATPVVYDSSTDSYYSKSQLYGSSTKSSSDSQSSNSASTQKTFSDSTSGLTFNYPSNWVLHENRPERDDLICDLNTKDNQCGMTVYDMGTCSDELFASLDSKDLYDLLPPGAKDFKEAKDYEKKFKANNATFIVLSGGIKNSSGKTANYSLCLTQHNKTAYAFSLVDYADTAESEKTLNDIIHSVSFK